MPGDFIDAYIGFSQANESSQGKDAFQIIGETRDATEVEWAQEWEMNNSMQIKGYDLGFELSDASTAEQKAALELQGWASGLYPKYKPVKITKTIDRGSPTILQALNWAAVFDRVDLWQRRAGASSTMAGGYYFWVTMYNVTITDLQWTSSADSPFPEESMTLKYDSIIVRYNEQTITGAMGDEHKTQELQEPVETSEEDDKLGGMSDSDLEKKIVAILKKNNVPVRR